MSLPRLPLVVACAVVALLAGRTARANTIRVFAASSLTEAFQEIGAVYEKAHPGDHVEFDFGGSQILRTQIEQGAPADVFASADLAQMEPLRRAGLVRPSRIFARNRLAVIASPKSGKVRQLQELAKPGVKIVVAGPTVPVGRYTTQALSKMNARYGDDFQTRVTANVVSQEVNVRAVLAKVMLGEADAGFVYITDAATARGQVRILDIPTRYNVVASYPLAVVSRNPARSPGASFVSLVLGGQGQAILRSHGFQK